ncbi:RDD family protein [Streptomyces sp. PSKA54]|uniref:RDD family protein n=1 Tax=Streptomyces himalayensis subsp. aureolus TaxID=2758039 RepID=A0A7W2HDZ0_9ACTN|nr:RDD family protein [Streptomyces himalayensis]MBA4860398.1 RDD family protein [Streptomyces himalayensis subsp. aureolus]
MSTEPPPSGSGQPPEDDPFRKKQPPSGDETPQGGSPYDTPQGGSPYDTPQGGGGPYGAPPPPGGGSPYGGGQQPPPPYGGGGPYGGGPYGAEDPLAGMPPLADSARRTLARIIDMIIVGIVVGLLSWAFGLNEVYVTENEVDAGPLYGRAVLAAVLYIAYDTFMIARSGQTLGKQWMKMRVANLSDGSTPSVQTSLVRAAVLWLPFAFCCYCIWTVICGGWSYFDKPYKQGLHDKAAKTVVVSTTP